LLSSLLLLLHSFSQQTMLVSLLIGWLVGLMKDWFTGLIDGGLIEEDWLIDWSSVEKDVGSLTSGIHWSD